MTQGSDVRRKCPFTQVCSLVTVVCSDTACANQPRNVYRRHSRRGCSAPHLLADLLLSTMNKSGAFPASVAESCMM